MLSSISTSNTAVTSGPWLRLILLPLLVALVILASLAFRKAPREAFRDEFYYLTIARDLNVSGVFTDGIYKRGPFDRGAGPADNFDDDPKWMQPGRFFAPAYPILVHLLSRLDRRLAETVRCQVRYPEPPRPPGVQCANAFGTLIAVNVALWAVAMLAIFLTGWQLTRSETVAWLAMIIALATGEPAFYARTYLSENITVPAFCLFMLFAMRAVDARRATDIVAAGLALGAASLSRPAYAYLFYLIVVLLAVALVGVRTHARAPRPREVALFAGGALLVVAPWMLRNLARFGDPALSAGYAEVILIQRLAYNQMTWAEWCVAWIYWLPDFGDDLAAKLFDPQLFRKLGWTDPRNYYVDGLKLGAFRERILAAAPTDRQVMPLLLRDYLLGDIAKHVAVSLPLTWRGLGVAKYLSVAGVALLWPALRELRERGRLAAFTTVAVPPVLMAGLHGFVSVNIERYNLPLIAVYAVIVAVVLERWRRIWHARSVGG